MLSSAAATAATPRPNGGQVPATRELARVHSALYDCDRLVCVCCTPTVGFALVCTHPLASFAFFFRSGLARSHRAWLRQTAFFTNQHILCNWIYMHLCGFVCVFCVYVRVYVRVCLRVSHPPRCAMSKQQARCLGRSNSGESVHRSMHRFIKCYWLWQLCVLQHVAQAHFNNR